MRNLLCILGLALLPLTGSAQTPDESVRTKIREIKLSEKYIYADATSMNNAEEAALMALEGLHVNVVGALTEQQKSKEEIESTWNSLKEQLTNIEYRNGELYKAFACIHKNKLIAGWVAEEPAAEETPAPQPAVVETPAPQPAVSETPQPEANETPAPQSAVSETPQPEANETPAPQPAVADTPQPDTAASPQVPVAQPGPGQLPVKADAPAQPEGNDPNAPAEENFNLPSIASTILSEEFPGLADNTTEPAAEEKPQTSETPQADTTPAQQETGNPIDALPENHQKILKDLLALDTYEGVMLHLDALKEDGRIMYGKISTLRSPETAYLIIIKDGQLLTILNTGKGARTNLKTLQPDYIKNYKGHGVIWMKLFK
ncbi:MAG: hypothetical protein IJ511_04395 [Bacteroides sp.]|nr:hypothetical protein [Bacteroides sp.]